MTLGYWVSADFLYSSTLNHGRMRRRTSKGAGLYYRHVQHHNNALDEAQMWFNEWECHVLYTVGRCSSSSMAHLSMLPPMQKMLYEFRESSKAQFCLLCFAFPPIPVFDY